LMQKNYIVVPWPKEESRLLSLVRPFQPAVPTYKFFMI